MNLDTLVSPLRADAVSGATAVARSACGVVRDATESLPGDAPDDWCEAVGRLVVAIVDAQPAMAPLVTLGVRVLAAARRADSVEAARAAVSEAALDFQRSLEERAETLARRAAPELPRKGTVLTLSSSSAVRATILHAARDRSFGVVCLESRPMAEGRLLAEALAREGVPVVFAVDAAAGALLPDADAVLLGADSIGDRGFVNKIGSGALAREARDAGIPVLIAADATKLLPPGFPQPVELDRPPEEVWAAPTGVRVWNRYFEAVPLDVVTRVITDEGTYSPGEMEGLRRNLDVPPELRRWADGGRV